MIKIRNFLGASLNQKVVTAIKKIIYGKRGEIIKYGNHTLRYALGTRPVRLSYIDSSDINARNDAKQIQFFLDNVKPGQTILDIGAHKGQYAVLFSSLVGSSGKVVSFEPDLTARSALLSNLKLNIFSSNVQVESLALSDVNGNLAFFSNNGDSMSSLVRSGLGTNATAVGVTEHVVVSSRLDDYLQKNGMFAPDWIKLDTEGAEINILKGAIQVLKSKTVIVCELHPYAWKEFGTSFNELLLIVKQNGRTIQFIDKSLRVEDGPVYGTVIIS